MVVSQDKGGINRFASQHYPPKLYSRNLCQRFQFLSGLSIFGISHRNCVYFPMVGPAASTMTLEGEIRVVFIEALRNVSEEISNRIGKKYEGYKLLYDGDEFSLNLKNFVNFRPVGEVETNRKGE